MHSRCSSDLGEESDNWEDIFSDHCELTEDKQVPRSVGSSRKADCCAGIIQRFEPRDVGYLPGVSRAHAVGAHLCRELCNGHRRDLELKKSCRTRMFRRASLGVSVRVMALPVHCVLSTKEILASYGCFTLHCFTTGFCPCTGNISIAE